MTGIEDDSTLTLVVNWEERVRQIPRTSQGNTSLQQKPRSRGRMRAQRRHRRLVENCGFEIVPRYT